MLLNRLDTWKEISLSHHMWFQSKTYCVLLEKENKVQKNFSKKSFQLSLVISNPYTYHIWYFKMPSWYLKESADEKNKRIIQFFRSTYPVNPLSLKIIMQCLHEPDLALSNTLSLPRMQLFSLWESYFTVQFAITKKKYVQKEFRIAPLLAWGQFNL